MVVRLPKVRRYRIECIVCRYTAFNGWVELGVLLRMKTNRACQVVIFSSRPSRPRAMLEALVCLAPQSH
jgi:hypothetical protein